MKKIRTFTIIIISALIVFFVFYQMNSSPKEVITKVTTAIKESDSAIELKENLINPEEQEELPPMNLEGDMYQWIGRKEADLLSELGEPDRIDSSAYNYEWYVYNSSESQYAQFAILDGTIVSVYAIGDDLEIAPLDADASYIEVADEFLFQSEVTYADEQSSYTFRLTAEDLQSRPLVKIDDSTFIQFYFDTITETLSSVRVSKAEALLLQRPYEIQYRGELPASPELTDEQWVQVQEGMEQQIFDISNIMRYKHGVPVLEWDEPVSVVAYDHSKDMFDNNYFSHVSLDGEGLKERLEARQVDYIAAGENIAAQYPDAPAAMEGWLNSESHREALLSEDYSYLGVGVYRFYYTQNFLGKPF